MCKIFNIFFLLLLLGIGQSSYLEFPLVRSPQKSKFYAGEPLVCKN